MAALSERSEKFSKIDQLTSFIQNPTRKNITIHMDKLPPVSFLIGDDMLISYAQNVPERLVTKDPTCIVVGFGGVIELSSYYYSFADHRPILDQLYKVCQPIKHDHFFNLLDFFSSVLQQEIELTDVSIKWINNYKVNGIIMYFVKEKSFYQIYGFANRVKETKLQEIGNKFFMIKNNDSSSFLSDVIPSNQKKIEKLIDSIDLLNSIFILHLNDEKRHYIKDIKPSSSEEDIRLYISKINDKTATVRDIVHWFYLLCEMNHPIITTEKFIYLMDMFTFILTQVTNIPYDAKQNTGNDWVRPVSTNGYDFDIEENAEQITLKIQSIPKSSAEAGGKRKTKKYKKKRKNTHRKNKI